jgi:hypothetical protein
LDLLSEDLKLMLPAVCKAKTERIPVQLGKLANIVSNPVNVGGVEHAPSSGLNLRHFGELMGRLADYLYGLDEAISYLVETKAEMESEWASEMASYTEHE